MLPMSRIAPTLHCLRTPPVISPQHRPMREQAATFVDFKLHHFRMLSSLDDKSPMRSLSAKP